jgi:predicted glycosyltransferase involved in capsule biosynthesis
MQNTVIPKFTYVIPFRFSNDRIIPLRRVLDWLSGFQNIEVMIVEQDKHSKISHLNLKANIVFVESDAPFNKAWAYNIALKRTISPFIIFGDADTIMNPHQLIESLKLIDSNDCVLPLKDIIKLEPNESAGDLNSVLSIKRQGFPLNPFEGITIFKKESLQRIGGWNEDFFGHGGYESKFQDMKTSKLLSVGKSDFTGYHFSHQQIPFDFGLSQRNTQLLDSYLKVDTNQLQQHIQMVSQRIGLLNKYQ